MLSFWVYIIQGYKRHWRSPETSNEDSAINPIIENISIYENKFWKLILTIMFLQSLSLELWRLRGDSIET